MGSTSRGLLDTLRSWFLPPYTDDDRDPRSECCGFGLCGSYRMDDGLSKEEVLNRAGPEKKYYQVYYDQPRPTQPIRATPQRSLSKGRLHKEKRRVARRQQGDASWMDKNFFSGKRKTVPRRPQISTPFNFQHTGSGAVDFGHSTLDLPRSAPPFRRLELSIYEPENQVSPLLPYFAGDRASRAVSPPEPALLTRDVFDDDDDTTLAHSRSHSSLSFHIPRRPVGGDGVSLMTLSNFGDSPPRIPPRARTRPRAYTSPSVEAIVERIASAIIERDLLQDEIESVKERQSFCMSRPSTSCEPSGECSRRASLVLSSGWADTDRVPDEPMPALPTVMPPTAPSFAERLSIDRPRTAPSTKTAFYPPPPLPPPKAPERAQTLQQPARRSEPTLPTRPAKQQAVQASAFRSHPPCASPKIIDNSIDVDVPLAPPLPLILRPPLRKKKSFSRVSNWLFPAGVEQQQIDEESDEDYSPTSSSRGRGRHRRDVSSDSVTNAPRALTEKDGYYQTLPPSAMFSGRRSSFDSMSDVLSRMHTGSVYSTDEEMYPGRVGTTTATSTCWSPANTPPEAARRQLGGLPKKEDYQPQQAAVSGHETKLSLKRNGTFGSEASSASASASSPVDADALRVRVQGPRPTSVGVAF